MSQKPELTYCILYQFGLVCQPVECSFCFCGQGRKRTQTADFTLEVLNTASWFQRGKGDASPRTGVGEFWGVCIFTCIYLFTPFFLTREMPSPPKVWRLPSKELLRPEGCGVRGQYSEQLSLVLCGMNSGPRTPDSCLSDSQWDWLRTRLLRGLASLFVLLLESLFLKQELVRWCWVEWRWASKWRRDAY